MNEVRFRVVSSHPTVSSAQLVSQLVTQVPSLTEHLRNKWPTLPDLSVEADREKSVPIDPATAYLVLKFLGEALAAAGGLVVSGFLTKLGEDAYVFLKNRIKNGTIDPPERQE